MKTYEKSKKSGNQPLNRQSYFLVCEFGYILKYYRIRRPLFSRRGCHQAADIGNQLCLGMFSAISLGFRFPLFISIHLSCSFCLDVCFQWSVIRLLVPQKPTNHHLPCSTWDSECPLKFIKNQRKTCT